MLYHPIGAGVVCAANLNGKVVGNTVLVDEFPPDTTQGLYPILTLFTARSIIGTGVITAPTVSLGTNSPNFDNIIPATSLSALVANLRLLPVLARPNSPILVSGSTSVNIRVSVASNATTEWRFNVGLMVTQLKTL